MSSTTMRQLSLRESCDRSRIWATNDSRALRISRKIGEMVAVDCQPLSIVNDTGVTRLMNAIEPRYHIPSRKYLTETVLPEIRCDVRDKVKEEIKGVSWLSFTSDIWSTEVSSDSLLSLTAHWLTNSFQRKYVIVHAQIMPGSHTAEALCAKYEGMFKEWDIKKEQIHLFVVDNASNMRRAMLDSDYPYLGCFSHTLQLVINDGVMSQIKVCQGHTCYMSS